jgi:hypothetical protein
MYFLTWYATAAVNISFGVNLALYSAKRVWRLVCVLEANPNSQAKARLTL